MVATTRLGLNAQTPGTNANTWGGVLNTQALELVDEAFGVETIPVAGNMTLTSTNFVSNQARNFALLFTPGGLTGTSTVTIPSREKVYLVLNSTGRDLIFSAGGATVTLATARWGFIVCNGTDVLGFDPVAVTDAAKTAAEAARDLAQQWATSLSVVSGGLKGARGYANDAASSATTATGAASTATGAASTTVTLYDLFDDRFLGAKASAPSLDNDGDPLIVGAIYFDTTLAIMRVWSGSAWQAFIPTAADYLPKAGGIMTGPIVFAASQTGVPILRSARTSNAMLAKADCGKFIDITAGTFTQTFAGASALGDGWWCYLQNSGDGDITLDPNGAETIDGLASFVMYPGEIRIVRSDGATLRSTVLVPFRRRWSTSGPFVKPPGYKGFQLDLLSGSGGGGGGGRSGSGSQAYAGGAGAGGFYEMFPLVDYDELADVETVTIGNGGNAGINRGVASPGSGTDGGVGGSTSVGAFATPTVPGGNAGSNAAAGASAGAGAVGPSVSGTIRFSGATGSGASLNTPGTGNITSSSNGRIFNVVSKGGDGGAGSSGANGSGSPSSIVATAGTPGEAIVQGVL